MKHLFFLCTIVLSLVNTSSFAQYDDDRLVYWGIKAGANFTTIRGNDAMGNSLNYDLKTGFHAGIKADMYVTENFYLRPELMYTLKGAESKNNSSSISHELSYVELPLSAVFKPEVGSGRFVLGAGPYIAYAVSGNKKIKAGGTTISLDAQFKNKISGTEYANSMLNTAYFVKPLDWGANLFTGYELRNGLSIQINGQLGLAETNPAADGVSADKSLWKNLGLGASLGYRF